MPFVVLGQFSWRRLRTFIALNTGVMVWILLTAYIYCQTLSQSSGEDNHNPPAPSCSWMGRFIGKIAQCLFGNEAAEVLLYSLTSSVFFRVVTTVYCLLLMAKLIRCIVFGPLRVNERQHLKDEFWIFLFYIFIFVIGYLNVQMWDERLMMWGLWFAVLGFLRLLVQLCKDRFEYLSSRPTPMLSYARLLVLLVLLLLCCGGLLLVGSHLAKRQGVRTAYFVISECMLVTVRATHIIFSSSFHLWDIIQGSSWERKASCDYYTDLLLKLFSLALNLVYHASILLHSNIWLLPSIIIFLQLLFIFNKMLKRIGRHHNYVHVLQNMESRFSAASQEELAASNDNCAICRNGMSSARKLPCGHLFHSSCLRSWLELNPSCPTCRMSVNMGVAAESYRRNARLVLIADVDQNQYYYVGIA